MQQVAKAQSTARRPVMVFLSQEDYDRLTKICESRQQSRADYLRAALTVPSAIPNFNSRPLVGICLDRHRAKLKRERRKAKRKA